VFSNVSHVLSCSEFEELCDLRVCDEFIVPSKCMVRYLTMCDIVQFSEMMCIRRSFRKKLLHFFMPFEL
jgi:hypothetical protein